ncbi:MAG: hypothetical protein Q7K57_15005 [Burkholderiaceae bacterium]|nr:hypothetical protein [Burkholderiaceae bacterium]
MPKKQKSPQAKAPAQAADPIVRTPWYRRVWFVLSLLGAGLYGLLANGPTLLANAEKLPADYERVSNQFLAWYYEDSAWEGLWSASPEGYVDLGDMKLSDVDMKLHLLVEHGRVGGEIAMKTICQAAPMFDYLLLEGKISGDTAIVTVFDFIGGERKNFFRFTAKRDGVVVTVSLKEGSPEWLPAPARIGLHPLRDGDDPYKSLIGTCSAEKEVFLKKIRPNGLGR